MIPKKIDNQTANTIKSMLQKLNIYDSRVLIDFQKETVESQDIDYSIDDLLEAAGVLSPDRAKELLDEVNQSRGEVNLFFHDYRMRSVCGVKTQ